MHHTVHHYLHHLRRLLAIRLLRLLRSHPILQSETVLALIIAISVPCGAVAVALHKAIDIVAHLLHTVATSVHGSWHMVVLVLTPAAGGFLAGLALRYLVPAARGSGIPQVKLDLVMHGGHIPFKVALGKFFTTAIAVGSGGSVGREGPTVQICASLGSSLAHWFPMSAVQLRTVVHAACVAGLAAAFNTPFAGMTFVMEEVIGDLNARNLGYLLFAAVSAAMTARFFMGDVPVFDVPVHTLGHPWELLLYVVLGLLAGVLSVAFIRLLIWSIARFQALPVAEFLKPALGGLLLGCIALFLPQILGMGYGFVTDAMQNRLPLTLLLILTLAKFISTILSYSSGTAGGLFAPALFIGAMLGGSLAHLADLLPGITVMQPGAFALVGMGAVFAGIIRTPLTSILMIFEMTNDYAIIAPLMLANMTSFLTARFFEPHNVYEAILATNNVHIPSVQDHILLEEVTAGEVMTRHPATLEPETPISEVSARFATSSAPGFAVVTPDQQLIGLVTRADIRRAVAQGRWTESVQHIAEATTPISAYSDVPLSVVMQQLGEHDMSFMPVISHAHPPHLLGVVTMSDILHAFAHTKTQV